MSEPRYHFRERSKDIFELYENGELLCEFTRLSFCERLEILGRGSSWIGSMLRLFHRSYPMAFKEKEEKPPFAKVLRSLGYHGIVDYLRQRGYRVYQRLPVSDHEMISYVRSRGYVV